MTNPLGHKLRKDTPMDAADVLNEAASLGVTIALDGGELRVLGSRDAVAELVPLLRLHKPSIVRLLAQRSAANDRQPSHLFLQPAESSARTPVPPEPHHQRQPSPLNSATQILGSTPPPPAPALTHAEWVTLAKAYQAHHFTCPVCIAAGKGYGLRCGTGAALWTEYDRATEPARTTPARKDVPQ